MDNGKIITTADYLKEAKEWAREYATFITGWTDENGAYNFIFRNDSNDFRNNIGDTYTIIRAFLLGSEIAVSVDAPDKSAKEIFEFLITNIEKRSEILEA